MLPTRTSDLIFKNAIHSEERVGHPSWNTISRPRKNAAQFLSIRRRLDPKSGTGWGGPFLCRTPQLVLAGLPRKRPVHARTRETPCQGRTLSRQNRQSGPKVCRV